MGEEQNNEGKEDVDTLLTLSSVDRAHASETRKLQCESPAEHTPRHPLTAHVFDTCARERRRWLCRCN